MSKNTEKNNHIDKDSKMEVDTDEFIPRIFEVEVKNRVLKANTGRPIKGIQGTWHEETIYWVTEHEERLTSSIIRHISSRRILGKPQRRLYKFMREIEILNIRRII